MEWQQWDTTGQPPLQLDEVSLNAIIARVSAKLSGVMHSEPASQKQQQQRQLVDTLTGELLVKPLIYTCYWHTHPAPAPPSGRINLDRATPCIHTCMHTSNLLLHIPLKSRTKYRLYCSWPTELYSGGHWNNEIYSHLWCFRASVAFVYYATVRAIANRIKCDFIFLIVSHLPQLKTKWIFRSITESHMHYW